MYTLEILGRGNQRQGWELPVLPTLYTHAMIVSDTLGPYQYLSSQAYLDLAPNGEN